MGQLTGSHKRGHRNPHMLQSPFDNEPLPSPPVPQRSPFLEHHYWRGTGFKTAAEVFEEQIESTREGGAPKSWNPGFETNDAFLLRLHAAETRDDKSERPHSMHTTLAVHTARSCYALPQILSPTECTCFTRSSCASLLRHSHTLLPSRVYFARVCLAARMTLKTESRSPPNYARGSSDVYYKDSSICPRNTNFERK